MPGNGGGTSSARDMQARNMPHDMQGGGMQSGGFRRGAMGDIEEARDMWARREMQSDMDRDMQTSGSPGSQTAGPGGGLAGGGLAGGGGLGDMLKGALGGLLAGSAAGGVMGGGLNDLIKQMEKHGFADTADSWVGPGDNKTIAPGDLAKVLGADQIDAMMQQSGLSRDELLDGLSRHLPEVVDRLTPEGEVPRHIPM
jgi:uncharacterized protein YidB (DUF937 family)